MTSSNDSIHNSEQGVQEGSTKREYFAAMAMQGLLASFTQKSAIGAWNNETKETAEASVHFADALIKALNETK